MGSLSVGSLGRGELQRTTWLVTPNNSKRLRKRRQGTELWQDGRHWLPPAVSWGFARTRVCLGRREEKVRKWRYQVKATLWKKPKCPQTEEWMWYIYTMGRVKWEAGIAYMQWNVIQPLERNNAIHNNTDGPGDNPTK